MAAPDYEETEIQDLLRPSPQPVVGIIKQQPNCLPASALKTSNSTKSNQLSVTILDLGQSCSDNEDQKSFLSNISTGGMDLQTNLSGNDDRRGSVASQREGYYGGKYRKIISVKKLKRS